MLATKRNPFRRRHTTIAFGAILALLFSLENSKSAQVVSVGDGDTIRVSEGSRRITVRLACIDAPETSQRPWGDKSTALLRQLTPIGSEVALISK